MKPPAPSRSRPSPAVAVGLLCYAPLAWLLLLNFHREEIGPGLDASVVAVLTRALADHARFGPEVCFNYGPLAALAVRTWDARIFGALFAAELALKAAVIVLVCRLAWKHPAGGAWRGVLPVAVVVVGAADWQALFFFTVTAAGWFLVGRGPVERALALPALLLLATMALVKGTLLVLAPLAVVAGAVACGWRRGNGWPAAWRIGGFGAVLVGVWVGIGQRSGDLLSFVRGTLDIAGGYSRGMSQPPEVPGVLALGLVTLAAAGAQIIFLAWSGRRERSALPMAGLLGATLFLAWKQGFTRADGHVATFFASAALGAAAAPTFFAGVSRRAAAWAQGMGFAVVLALAVAGTVRAGVESPSFFWRTLADRARSNPAIMRDPRAEADRARVELAHGRAAYALPRVRAAVGGATVDFFGFEQGVLLANGLRYTPPPVPQGYQVNTPFTQRINQEFYRGPRAPEFVVFKLQPMDGHPPTAENAGVLATLALDYAPVLFEKGYELLRRVAPPSPEARPLPFGRMLAEEELALDQPLTVPPVGPDEMVWCEISVRETARGKALATAYQLPPIHVEATVTEGPRPPRYRLVPGMVGTGFLLSPLVGTERALVDLQAGRAGLPGVTALRLQVPPEARRFYEPRWGCRLRILPRPAGAVREAAERALGSGALGMFTDITTPEPTRIFSEVAAGTRFRVGKETFLFVHPPGEVELPVPAGATHARGDFTFDPAAWQGGNPDGVLVRVDLEPPGGGAPVTLFSRLLLPGTVAADREVGTFDVPLPPGAAGGRVRLRTLNHPATGLGGRGWIGFGGVRVE